MSQTTGEQVAQTRITYYSSVFGSLALCLAIHLAAPIFADDRFFRLMMVLLFFGCLASATWSFSEPYRLYEQALFRWRYADAGPAVQHNIERYLIRKSRFTSMLSNLATAGVGFIGLGVLSQWKEFAVLAGLDSLFLFAGGACLFLLPLVAVFRSGQIREAVALRRQFEEEAQISGARVRTAHSERVERKLSDLPAVVLTENMRFNAGGYNWRWSDFYKNVAVFGQSGTGKTVCVLNALLDGLVGSSTVAGNPAAGLILDPKGDFRDKILTLCEEHGRQSDLLLLDPYDLENSITWNPLDSDDNEVELAGRFGAIMELLNPSGGDDRFWIDSAVRLVQNLIALSRLAHPEKPPSVSQLYKIAMSDPQLDKLGQEINFETYNSSAQAKDIYDYFFDIWKPMPENTKATVRSFLSNMLGYFLLPPYDTIFAGKSTVRLSNAITEGKIVYVHMPIADQEVMSRVISTFVKLEYYREVLKNKDKQRPSFFLCDEFQSFFTVGQGKGDADAFERTRGSNHANIVAFQNLNALFKQTDKREPVLNMLGNCATQIFLRNTEQETNEYASALFGEHIETLSSASVSVPGGRAGQSSVSGSVSGSVQYSSKIKKDEFTNLGVPSIEESSLFAHAIAHLGARPTVEVKHMKWKVHPIGKSKSDV